MIRKTSGYIAALVCIIFSFSELSASSGISSVIAQKQLHIRNISSVAESSSNLKTTNELYPHVVKKDSSLYLALRELNISPFTIFKIAEASKKTYNLSRLMPGTRFQLQYSSKYSPLKPQLSEVSFLISPIDVLTIFKNEDSWLAEIEKETIETKVVHFSGSVETSLWESAQAANMPANLVSDLAEIFAWQIDFAREVRVKDRWRIAVEQRWARGEIVGWGDILVAEYENQGLAYKAILFKHEGEKLGYFTPEGENLRKMFLKSPIRYGRISSGFQRRRFHPILKVNRPHLGVDYAARTGTPIRAVGDGRIQFAGRNGGAGNMIKIRHNSVYKTAYKHLSRFAKGIKRGKKIRQGDIIGYVGSTGLSTGPHLHYEFFRHGRYVDPLRQDFPSADPVPQKLMMAFQSHSHKLLASLPSWEIRKVSQNNPDSDQTF